MTSAARVTAACSRGRPATRTSCLADPKRVEAPAASTTAYKPFPTRPLPSDANKGYEPRGRGKASEAPAGRAARTRA